MSDTEREADRRDDPGGPGATVTDFDGPVDRVAMGDHRQRRAERRQRHRRAALGLAVLGALALVGALVLPDARSVLLALSGVGLFGAVLLRWLPPERLVAPETGESVYAALASTGEQLVAERDLTDDRLYVPTRLDGDEPGPVRLFVPAQRDVTVPDSHELTSLSVTADDGRIRGIAVQPTGAHLYHEFRSSVRPDVADDPELLARQVVDALVSEFELVDWASSEATSEHVTVAVAGVPYGSPDRFDHPVVSLVAVSLAATLGVPVAADVTTGDGRADYHVTCTWGERGASGPPSHH